MFIDKDHTCRWAQCKCVEMRLMDTTVVRLTLQSQQEKLTLEDNVQQLRSELKQTHDKNDSVSQWEAQITEIISW